MLSEADAAVQFPDGATKVDGSLEVREVPGTDAEFDQPLDDPPEPLRRHALVEPASLSVARPGAAAKALRGNGGPRISVGGCSPA